MSLVALVCATLALADAADDSLLIIDDAAAAAAPVPAACTTPSGSAALRLGARSRLLVHPRGGDEQAHVPALQWWNVGRARIDYDAGASLGATAEAWLRWGATASSPAPDATFVGTNARDGAWSHDVALREGYVTWRLEAWTLRAGARLYSWGKNEWLAPANVLNPIDLRYDPFSVLEGPKDGRVPVWALDTSTDALGATWQLVVLPFFVPHALFVYGHEVSAEPFAGLYAPLLRDTLGALEPGARDALQGGMRGTRLPADSPGGASAALRVTRQLAGWDVAATGYYGWDRTPWIDLDADVATLLTAQARISADPTLLARDPALRTATLGVAQKRAAGVRLADVSYRRTGQLALEGERALGPMVVRLDVGYSPAQTLYTRELAPHRRGAWTGVVGVDAMQGDALITSVGLWGMVVPSPPANGVLLGLEPATDTPQARRAAWTMAALGAVRWHPADTAFEASAFATFGVRRRETVVWAQVAYMGFEPYRLALGCFGATGRAGSLTAALEAERYVFAQVSGAW